jgi:hypothetical protein
MQALQALCRPLAAQELRWNDAAGFVSPQRGQRLWLTVGVGTRCCAAFSQALQYVCRPPGRVECRLNSAARFVSFGMARTRTTRHGVKRAAIETTLCPLLRPARRVARHLVAGSACHLAARTALLRHRGRRLGGFVASAFSWPAASEGGGTGAGAACAAAAGAKETGGSAIGAASASKAGAARIEGAVTATAAGRHRSRARLLAMGLLALAARVGASGCTAAAHQ